MTRCSTLPSKAFYWKPDFDECMARIYAWYEQEVLDRPPVRFHHHNLQYEQFRTAQGDWTSFEERWLDADFQIRAFLESAKETRFLGETFPVYMPDLSAVVYNLFLGQRADFEDVTVWTRPSVTDLENLPNLEVQWDNRYFRAIDTMTREAIECAEGRFLVGYSDLYAGVDCAMGLRGMQQLCFDLIESPDGVRRLLDRTLAVTERLKTSHLWALQNQPVNTDLCLFGLVC